MSMLEESRELALEYSSALREYISSGEESTLLLAANLGRFAMAAGFGVLEMVVMHHESLAGALAATREPEGRTALEAASQFLCEALSPFEITHKGFREATEVTRRVLWLASVVSHELRTPLTSVINSAGMLQEVLKANAGSVQARLLSNVIDSAQILKARTDEMAELVGLQSGTLPLRYGPVDVAALLGRVAQHMESQLRAAEMELVTQASPGLPSILADGKRLEQVVANLIQNAIKYGSDGRRIDLRAFAREDSLIVEVQDYGAGISLWDRMSLFQPYFRGEQGSKEVPGVGLGLALCRQLIELHHGSISVETEKGKGSLFRIVLPVGTR